MLGVRWPGAAFTTNSTAGLSGAALTTLGAWVILHLGKMLLLRRKRTIVVPVCALGP